MLTGRILESGFSNQKSTWYELQRDHRSIVWPMSSIWLSVFSFFITLK